MTAQHLTRRKRGSVERASVRELAEVTRWAFVAAGASAGEALVAGRIVQAAEVVDGVGIDAALAELQGHCFVDAPIERRVDDGLDVVTDRFDRGLLTLGPPVAAAVAAAGIDGPPVLIEAVGYHPVVPHLLADSLGMVSTPVGGLAVASSGVTAGLAIATSNGACGLQPPGDPAGWELGLSLAPRPGLMIAPLNAALIDPEVVGKRTAQVAERWAAALNSGVEVEAGPWAELCAASKKYLVEES